MKGFNISSENQDVLPFEFLDDDATDMDLMNYVDIEKDPLFVNKTDCEPSSHLEGSESYDTISDDDIVAFYQDEEDSEGTSSCDEGPKPCTTTSMIKSLSASRVKPDLPSPQPHKKRLLPRHPGEELDSMDWSSHQRRSTSHRSFNSLMEDDTYRKALSRFQESMKRSEEPVVVRQRRLAEQKRQNRVNGFLTGSRSTLTTGLEQSRQMLKTYLTQMKADNL